MSQYGRQMLIFLYRYRRDELDNRLTGDVLPLSLPIYGSSLEAEVENLLGTSNENCYLSEELWYARMKLEGM